MPGIDRLEQRIDVLPIEPRAVLDDVAERLAVVAQPSGERPAGVELRRVQRRAAAGTRRRTCRGRDDRRTPSTSPSECAGSVDTTRTRRPAAAAATARAAAQVVLPTPPLPPKKMNAEKLRRQKSF